MTKTTAPEAATGLGTFRLSSPVSDAAGVGYESLTIAEPLLIHRITAQRATTAGKMAQTAGLIAILTGTPADAVAQLKMRDAMAIGEALSARTAEALALDQYPMKTVDVVDPETGETTAMTVVDADAVCLAGARTFKLLVPIVISKSAVTDITVNEPDIASGIKAEKFKLQAEQTVAIIASLSGQPMQLVQRMATADAERIERWFNFFSQAGTSLPLAPAKVATPATDALTTDATAGAASPPSSASASTAT